VAFTFRIETPFIPPAPRSSDEVLSYEDLRLRARLGGELNLDPSGTFRLTLDQMLLVSISNVAFDPNDPRHQFDYGDRNFIQPITELGVLASFL
jgi:hypothetical protein